MELTIFITSLLLLLGLLSGVISAIAGIGGGVFFVSIMTLLFYIPINIAVDTSTFIILFSAFAGFITYLRQKRTTIKLSLIFSGFSILGSILSTIIFSFVSVDNLVLKLIFALTLFIAGFNMIYKANKSSQQNNKQENKPLEFFLNIQDNKLNFKKSIPLFILAGFTANLLGIGGGIINTPSLNLVLGFPIHNSTAISTSIIFFTAIYNTVIKSFFGRIDYLIGFIIAIGSIIGSILGAKISKRIPKRLLQYFVAAVLLVLALRMFF